MKRSVQLLAYKKIQPTHQSSFFCFVFLVKFDWAHSVEQFSGRTKVPPQTLQTFWNYTTHARDFYQYSVTSSFREGEGISSVSGE